MGYYESLKNKALQSNDIIICDLPCDVTPETALAFLGLDDTYTVKEITDEEYNSDKDSIQVDNLSTRERS